MQDQIDQSNIAVDFLREGISETKEEIKLMRKRLHQLESTTNGLAGTIIVVQEKLNFIFNSLEKSSEQIEVISKSQTISNDHIIRIKEQLSKMDTSFSEIEESHKIRRYLMRIIGSGKFWTPVGIIVLIIAYAADHIKGFLNYAHG